MKNLKKVLALVLAFSMMLSVVAFASYNDVDADADYAGAVELLSALDIIKGDDLGNFNPDNTITRAEFAAIVCRAKGLENAAEGAKGATSFKDVAADHWASGYINLATQNGIINGYGDGNFGPEDKVTYEQAVKMLVCALGFEPMAANKGGYPTGYLVVANQYKITAGVKSSVEAPRKTVAQLVYNALTTPMMDQTSYGTDAAWEVLDGKNDREYKTLLTDMDVYIATGVVGAKVQGEDKVDFNIKESSDDYEFGYAGDNVKKSDGYNKIYNGDADLQLYINESNIQDYKNQYVDAYVLKDGKDYYVLAVVPSTMGDSITINSDDIDWKNSTNTKIEYFVDSKNTKTIKLNDKNGIDVQLNEGDVVKGVKDKLTLAKEAGFYDAAATDKFDTDADVELTFIENDGDSKFDTVVALAYTSERVKDVEADRDRMELQSATVKFDFDDDNIDTILVDEKGNALTLEDFKKDDVVAYYTDNGKLRNFKYIKVIKLTTAAVTGTVDEISTDGKTVWINKTEYDLAKNMVGDVKNEDEGTFYIGMTGKIVDFEGSSASKDYAYILEAGKSTSTFSSAWELKLLTAKDGVVTYTMTDDCSKDFEAKGTDGKYTGYLKNFTLSDGKIAFENKDAAYRFVTFKTNSVGKIKSIEQANGTLAAIGEGKEYKVATQKIDAKTLEDDVVIYNLDASVDSVYTTDISALVDEGVYGGYVFKDKDGDNVAMIITSDPGSLSNDTGFAVITNVRLGKNDGSDIVTVEYYQDGETGTVVFDDDSDAIANTGSVAPSKLGVGDVIMFTANADGIVNKYAVLAQINSKGLLDANTKALKAFDSKNEFYYGFIANDKADKKSKGENLDIVAGFTAGAATATAKTLTIGSSANKYTYNDANKRNIEIVEGDFLGGADTDYFETITEKDKADTYESTMVFVRVVEDDVVDIYSFNNRVAVASYKAETDNAPAEFGKATGVKTFYIKCTGKESTATVEEFDASKTTKTEVAAPAEDAVVTEKDAETVEID